jgi:hypothetical protein
MSDDIPDVCFVEDVARALRVSARQIRRLRRHGCFPIREIPSIDNRPRWSGAAVRRFIETGDTRRLRRVG